MTEMSNRKRASNDQLPTIFRLVPIPPELAPKIYSLGSDVTLFKEYVACSEQAKIMWRINKKNWSSRVFSPSQIVQSVILRDDNLTGSLELRRSLVCFSSSKPPDKLSSRKN